LHAQGRTILFVTHNQEIARYGSRNIVLRDGKVIEDRKNGSIASAKDTLASLPAEEE
jgi:putative ABC transport system ATP-binding protein